MTISEYREKHPKCKYCKYGVDVMIGRCYCYAKRKRCFLNKARKCKVYRV